VHKDAGPCTQAAVRRAPARHVILGRVEPDVTAGQSVPSRPSATRRLPARRRLTRAALLTVAAVLALAGCASDDGGDPADSPAATPSPTPGAGTPTASLAQSPTATPTGAPSPTAVPPGEVRLSVDGVVATGLRSPWGLAFLPDGSALITERDTARVLRVTPDGDVSRVGTVDGVRHGGEGGLMGVAVGPDFASDRLVYLYYTAPDDNRVVRVRWPEGESFGRPRVLVDGIPRAGNHNGGRLAFGPDGMLYVATGDASVRATSQDAGSLGGKILRIRPDGSIPDDNPDPRSPVWSTGHRNVQGLAFDSRGRLWASEFGQNTWDELNLIRPGRNYGWPAVEGRGGGDRYVDPVAQWPTDDASPSGVAVVAGARGESVLVAGLRGRRLWAVPTDPAGGSGDPRAWFTGDYGRLRTVALAPDGSVWLVTSNTDGRANPGPDDDRILRLSVR
jgi:glucose/arabinose dehydrogenase